MSENVVHINDKNWKPEVLDSAIPVLVDFWAQWCGPCLAIGPVLEQVAKDLAGKLKVVKVNVDENQALAGEFGIRSIPTLLVFKAGAVQAQMVGAMGKADLLKKIQPHL
ncbi:MAG: thioredoxin [Lentisphaerae bacterium]|nr:thioredoxin [Lentisphaerota bacterium]